MRPKKLTHTIGQAVPERYSSGRNSLELCGQLKKTSAVGLVGFNTIFGTFEVLFKVRMFKIVLIPDFASDP